MSDNEVINPCPFCGKSVAYVSNCMMLEECNNFESCKNDPLVMVICDSNKGGCGASGGYKPTKEEAIRAWNRRERDISKMCLDAHKNYDGTCSGYQRSDIDDEPCDMCMDCPQSTFYEDI